MLILYRNWCFCVRFHPDKATQRRENKRADGQISKEEFDRKIAKAKDIFQRIAGMKEEHDHMLQNYGHDDVVDLEDDNDQHTNWQCPHCSTGNKLSSRRCKNEVCQHIPHDDETLAETKDRWEYHCQNLCKSFLALFKRDVAAESRLDLLVFVMTVRGYDPKAILAVLEAETQIINPEIRRTDPALGQADFSLLALEDGTPQMETDEPEAAAANVAHRQVSPRLHEQLGGACWLNPFVSGVRQALSVDPLSPFRNQLLTLLRINKVRNKRDAIAFINDVLLFDAPLKLETRSLDSMVTFAEAFQAGQPIVVTGNGNLLVHAEPPSKEKLTLKHHSVCVDHEVSRFGQYLVMKNSWGSDTEYRRVHLNWAELAESFSAGNGEFVAITTTKSLDDVQPEFSSRMQSVLEARVNFYIDAFDRGVEDFKNANLLLMMPPAHEKAAAAKKRKRETFVSDFVEAMSFLARYHPTRQSTFFVDKHQNSLQVELEMRQRMQPHLEQIRADAATLQRNKVSSVCVLQGALRGKMDRQRVAEQFSAEEEHAKTARAEAFMDGINESMALEEALHHMNIEESAPAYVREEKFTMAQDPRHRGQGIEDGFSSGTFLRKFKQWYKIPDDAMTMIQYCGDRASDLLPNCRPAKPGSSAPFNWKVRERCINCNGEGYLKRDISRAECPDCDGGTKSNCAFDFE